jgi:hypothetical protein
MGLSFVQYDVFFFEFLERCYASIVGGVDEFL